MYSKYMKLHFRMINFKFFFRKWCKVSSKPYETNMNTKSMFLLTWRMCFKLDFFPHFLYCGLLICYWPIHHIHNLHLSFFIAYRSRRTLNIAFWHCVLPFVVFCICSCFVSPSSNSPSQYLLCFLFSRCTDSTNQTHSIQRSQTYFCVIMAPFMEKLSKSKPSLYYGHN